MMLGLGTMPGPSEACARVALTCLPPKGMVYFPNPFPDRYADCECQDNPFPYVKPQVEFDSKSFNPAYGPGDLIPPSYGELPTRTTPLTIDPVGMMLPAWVLPVAAVGVLFLFMGGKR
jgi:hypothetical protein